MCFSNVEFGVPLLQGARIVCGGMSVRASARTVYERVIKSSKSLARINREAMLRLELGLKPLSGSKFMLSTGRHSADIRNFRRLRDIHAAMRCSMCTYTRCFTVLENFSDNS